MDGTLTTPTYLRMEFDLNGVILQNYDDGEGWTTVTPNTSSTEPKIPNPSIDTVIIIIWAFGGALLVTLIVLMVCILRSHQKGRRERASLRQVRGTPRHGGVNQGFSTNYDDIWTWIPVITDSQARCPSQNDPSARGNSSQQLNNINQQRTLLNNLRLPSYNEAVRNSSQCTNTTNQTRSNHIVNQVINSRNNPQVPIRQTPRAQPSAPPVRALERPSPEHHYETIPHDRRNNTSVNRNSNSSASNQITALSVTSSSGASLNRMATRVSVDQLTRSAVPHAGLDIHSPGSNRRTVPTVDQRIVSGNLSVNTNNRPQRTTSSNIYPMADSVSPRQAFQHSTSSVFTYCANHGSQRVYSDIPTSVSAVYEAPTLQIRGITPSTRHDTRTPGAEPISSLSQSSRDALRRLESEYF